MRLTIMFLVVGTMCCAAPVMADVPGTAPATIPAVDAATAQAINSAIKDLHSGSYKVRQRASLQLSDIGPAALPALRSAATSSEAEVRTRALEIMGNVMLGITPRTEKGVAELVRLYRTSKTGARRAPAYQLLELGHKADEIVQHLADTDASPEMRVFLIDGLAQRAGARAAGAIADRQMDRAQEILCGVWKSEYESTWRDAAAFALQTDRISSAIAAIREPVPGETNDWRIGRKNQLAYLHRASGDLTAAIADLTGVRNLLVDSLRIEAGQWTTASANATGDVKRIVYRLLAGAGEAAVQRAAMDAETHTGLQCKDLIKLHLLTGSPDRAVVIAAGEKGDEAHSVWGADDPPAAFEIMRLLGRYDDALALADRGGTEQLFLEAIRLRVALGQTKNARERVDAQFQKWGPHSAADGPIGVQLRLLVGQEQEALVIAARLQTPQGAVDETLRVLFPEKLDDATFWFHVLQPIDGPAALPRLYALLNGRMPRDEARRYLSAALRDALVVPTANMAGTPSVEAKIASVAQGLMADHLDAEAADVLEKNPISPESFDALMLAARRIRAQGDFAHAARLYHRAWEPDALDPNPMFREGECLWQAGEKSRGQELMDRALLLPLGDDDRRMDLITALGALGKTELARRQMIIFLRTCDPQNAEISTVLRWLLRHPEAGESLETRENWAQRMVAAQVSAEVNSSAEGERTGGALAAMIESRQFWDAVQIEKLIAGGQIDAAVTQAKRDLERWPLGDDYVVPVIRALDRTGRRGDGDALYQSVAAAHEKILAAYPDASEIHNNAAWIAAETGRDLDAALKHATRATALKPDDGNLWNTLAAVHGARGEWAAAIEANRKALGLIPEQPDFLMDMQVFEQRLAPTTAPQNERTTVSPR